MEQAIDLKELLKLMKKNFWLIFLVPLLFLIVSLAVSIYLITPKYEGTTQILVNQKKTEETLMAQQVQSNLQLVNTYSEIIKSPRILGEVSSIIDNEYSADEINKMLEVDNLANSQILNIKIVSEDSDVSNLLANTIAQVFSVEIKEIMNIDNVSILSAAEGQGEKVQPKLIINALIGIVLGIILVSLWIFIKQVVDKRIKNEDDVTNILEVPVLGNINKVK